MVNGVIHSNTPTNLFALTRDFSDADANKYIRRESKSELLHTTSTIGGAIVGFFAKIGIGVGEQKKEREAGVAQIRQMIASEFREFDLPDRVFAKIKDATGRDLSQGVKVGDLELIRQTAKELNSGFNAYVPKKVGDEAFVYTPHKDKTQERIAQREIQIPSDPIGENVKLMRDIEKALNRQDSSSDVQFLNLLVDIRLNEFDERIGEVQIEFDQLAKLGEPDITDATGDVADLLKFAEEKGVVDDNVALDFDEVLGLIKDEEEIRADKKDTIEKLADAILDVLESPKPEKTERDSYAPIFDFSEIDFSKDK